MYCQVLHLNGSGTLDYGDTEGTTVPPNIYYSTRVLLVLYFLTSVRLDVHAHRRLTSGYNPLPFPLSSRHHPLCRPFSPSHHHHGSPLRTMATHPSPSIHILAPPNAPAAPPPTLHTTRHHPLRQQHHLQRCPSSRHPPLRQQHPTTTAAHSHPGINPIATSTSTTASIPFDDFDLDLPSDLCCVRISLPIFCTTYASNVGSRLSCTTMRRKSALSLCSHLSTPRRFIFIFVFQLHLDMELGSDTSQEALASSMMRAHLIPPSSSNYMDGTSNPIPVSVPRTWRIIAISLHPSPPRRRRRSSASSLLVWMRYTSTATVRPGRSSKRRSFRSCARMAFPRVEEGHLTSPHFDPLHNMALYQFLFKCVKQNVAVFAVLRRAPSGDGHTGYCFLSEQYGMRDFAAIQAYIQFFQPHESELPLAAALRLEGLYDELDWLASPPLTGNASRNSLLFYLNSRIFWRLRTPGGGVFHEGHHLQGGCHGHWQTANYVG